MTATSDTTARQCLVDQPMNQHGYISLSLPTTGETFHIVEYKDNKTQTQLETAHSGCAVFVVLDRIGCRAETWRARSVELLSEYAMESCEDSESRSITPT
ncbi:hypothetical protein [Natronocalculus amylovorans]|uniref:DUF7999 domain-containing protein n=1 Tax=Natronocalculus amylovorans TaxID=2917812 RepID=A0AAE3FWK0_9EURY|nr:hypothetical protein [Natronocalculus amylovorans]MCL9816318.1 hypothetical protein [Natronocalculus amylovorans]